MNGDPALDDKDTNPPVDHRPLRWEDDISFNAADTRPFENGRPTSQWVRDELRTIKSGRVPGRLREVPLLSLVAKDNLPVPNSEYRKGYSVDHDEWFWLSGLNGYFPTTDMLADRQIIAAWCFIQRSTSVQSWGGSLS
ncbi:MAG: hypothetical protein AAGE80_04935 [Pseudomonadota bacterium]